MKAEEIRIDACTEIYNKETANGAFYRICQDLDFYQYIPKYKASMSILYGIIANYYNSERGYAYPTQYQLLERYATSIGTLRSHLRTLEDVGLITIYKNKIGNNNCYVPHTPLSKEKLFEKCPQIRAIYDEKMTWIKRREHEDRSRLDELNSKIKERQKADEAAKLEKEVVSVQEELEGMDF
ncbi:hypothetical protein DN389_05570 [Bacillus sp. AY3-1]|uniref:hypothetical protein n=1 Tax=Bacillus sp. AY3-1 TaxID=2217817 RepID=UPI0011EEDADF|nr:hypothetical protein [Bacillus sp. AY3-1]KAA0747501.1 hypothetical protein DN389_05570 [Bacillus sp. AY3-1]